METHAIITTVTAIVDSVRNLDPAYEVERVCVHRAGGGFVLVNRGTHCPFPEAPFVTWEFTRHGAFLHTGHYNMDEQGGNDDFIERARRGY